MLFADHLTLDAPKRLNDGYMAVRAKAARLGHYQYLGREVDPENKHGLRDKEVINVLRDENTVFDEASARSFIGKPVTDDHPSKAVTADNWRDHARGTVMGAMREGDYLAFDLLLTDAEAIRKIDAGKRELSNGYSAGLEFGDFTAPDGTKCEVRQTRITGNHVALVDRGRAGSACAITDAAACEGIPRAMFDALVQRTYTEAPNGDKTTSARSDASRPLDGGSHVATKTITFDGLPLEVTDAAEAAINKLTAKLADAASAQSTADTALASAKTELAAKDAEIVTLKKSLEDAKITPAQLRDAAKAHALVCDKAKAMGVAFADDTDAGAVMKAVVDAKMGDAAKGWNADQIAASFAVLTKDAKAADPLRDAVINGIRSTVNDNASVRDLARASQY